MTTPPQVPDGPVGRIFLSYRRTDSAHVAGRLYDRFSQRFGVGNVFMDVDSIDAGLDFVESIKEAVASCGVLVAVIGRAWLDATDERGRRRLENPHDFVALEIGTALRRDIRVIPVLIDGTPDLEPETLPGLLAPLARRYSVRLDYATFGTGFTVLMTAVERALRARATPPTGPTPGSSSADESATRPKPPPPRAPAPSDLEEKIDRAVRARTEQRPLVDQLVASWTDLSRRFSDLVLAAGDIGRARSSNDPDTLARAAIAAVLAGEGDAPALTLQLEDRARNVEHLFADVQARVGRDTVEIGVIGSARAGRSTLLRTVSGLPDTVIPSGRFTPTTATPVRVRDTRGRAGAVLTLHTWESFRDDYLAPLHEAANLGDPPKLPADFARHRYPDPDSGTTTAAADQHLRKLRTAQSSFASYAYLLTGSARTIEVEFAALPPYVTYPEDRGSMNVRPYHAVRVLCITQRFPDGAAIGLLDLPMPGEAGLEVDRRLAQQIRTDIDFLLLVRRGAGTAAFFSAEDYEALAIADSARDGAALEDFLAVVVNRDGTYDPTGEYFTHTLAEMRRALQDRRIPVLGSDVSSHDDVQQNLLRPVFDHLAATLARMDRANLDAVRLEAGQTAAEIAAFAEDLAAHAERQLSRLPNQEFAFRDVVRRLLEDVAVSLYALREQYDSLLGAPGGDAEPLTRDVNAAVRAARTWVDDGLGRGSPAAWFTETDGAWVVGARYATQQEYYRVRTQLATHFADVDASLEQSVHGLWNQTADALRSHLTPELVPTTATGREALEHLRHQAAQSGAPMVRGALDQLLGLRAALGSLVLRVTGPIIRTMDERDVTIPAPPPLIVPTYDWVTLPDGSRRQVRIDAAATASPGVVELYTELVSSARDALDMLEVRLTSEARTATAVLAAAASAFFEGMVRTTDVAWEYEAICGPYRSAIWPEEFKGNLSGLAVELSDLQKQAQLLIAASTVGEPGSTAPRSR